jgi:hypothetical protein
VALAEPRGFAAAGREARRAASDIAGRPPIAWRLRASVEPPAHASSPAGGAAVSLRLEQEIAQPRVQVFLRGPRFHLTLGQTPLRNAPLRFPTVREEDLLAYTHIPNGALGLEDPADQLFGDSLILEGFRRPGFWRAALFSERRKQADGTGDFRVDEEARPNTLGALIAHDVPESVKYEH